MRFSLTLNLEKNIIPIEYRKIILSYIKNAISKCNNGKYYDDFFKDTIQKDYSFSVILPKSKFSRNEIDLEDNQIKILFTTHDENKAGLILFNAFIAQKNRKFPLPNENSMILKSITMNKREEIINSKVIFKTTLGSALCVREHNRETNKDIYHVYNDTEFREKLAVVLNNQIKEYGLLSEIGNIKVNPIQCNKVVIKHYRRFIDASVGMFQVEGDPKILQYLYDVGIGSRRSSGFGMIDLITQDLI